MPGGVILCISLKKEKYYVIDRPVWQLYKAAMPLPIDCGVCRQ